MPFVGRYGTKSTLLHRWCRWSRWVTVDVRCSNSPNKFVLSPLGNSPPSNWNQPPVVGLLSERRHDELWLRPSSSQSPKHTCFDTTKRWFCLLAFSPLVVMAGLYWVAGVGAKDYSKWLWDGSVETGRIVVGVKGEVVMYQDRWRPFFSHS